MGRILRPAADRRPAFTLIELLVVMGIILALSALAVGTIGRFGNEKQPNVGADRLQGWLLIAKQRAKRDMAPRGVRLFRDPTSRNPNFITQCQYIGYAGDWNGGGGVSVGLEWDMTNPKSPAYVYRAKSSSGPIFTPPANSGVAPYVQRNDYLELYGGGLVYQIQNVQSNYLDLVFNPLPGYIMPPAGTVSPTAEYPTRPATAQYRVIRQAQPLAGEEPLILPQGIVIDVNTNAQFGNQVLQTNNDPWIDILFAPTGGLVGWPIASNKIILWIRDQSETTAWGGSPALIAVYVRTGNVAAYPIDPTPNPKASDPTTPINPYTFTLTGAASGL
jgi:prepilin-type N-terminal cleavage/methylation domain-containing protein